MAILDTSRFSAAFKESYGEGSDVLVEQQNLNAPFFSTIKVSDLKPSARGIYSPQIMEGNENGGAINENEAFEEVGSVLPIAPLIYSKTIAWQFQISGKTFELARQGQKVAFADGLDTAMTDASRRCTSDLDRQSNGVGTGQITLANGSGSGATSLIVDNALPFRIGMYIDSYASLGGAKEIGSTTACRITNVNPATNTLTLSSAQTWSDNSIICKRYKLDGVTSASNAKEMMGIDGIVDTTTYSTTFESVSVSTYPQWQGNVVDAGTSPISQDFLQQAFNRVSIIGGEKPDLLYSNYGQARTFLNSELNKVRYAPQDVKAGNEVLKWGTMTWVVSHTAPTNEVFMLNKKYIEKFQTGDLRLADGDGQTIVRTQGRDSYGGFYRYEGNIGTFARNRHGKIINLTEPSF